MKRHLTSIFLIALLAAFMTLGYFVSPIFIDMLIMLFFAGSLYEMYKCLKDSGYHMFKAPPVFVLLTIYPVFYLMQYYMGGGDNKVSSGIQGILIVILAAALMCLSAFTFKPAAKEWLRNRRSKSDASDNAQSETDASSKEENFLQEQATLSSYDKNATSDDDNNEYVNFRDEDVDGGDISDGGYLAGADAENKAGKLTVADAQNGADDATSLPSSNDRACNLSDLFANIFLLVYPTLFLSAAFVISYKYSAFFAILFAIAVPIIGSDLFAYLFGKMIGGKKLCPSISPKKTVAGACGGVFGGVCVAILLWVIFEYVGGELAPEFIAKCGYVPLFAHANGGLWKSALVYVALGAICAAISELGDLAASRIKRSLGIKDYGWIFPGHGGFLDRIDSVMYSLVVLLIALSCIYGY